MNFKASNLLLVIIILLCTCKQNDTDDNKTVLHSYNQANRPQLHYTSNSSWMGVPVASVYLEGEYHLFYQLRSEKAAKSTMSWGHAVSENLTHWQELKTVLSPDPKGEIYPGSVVIDWDHTSGFNPDGEPPMVATYAYNQAGVTQSLALAYSIDQGRSWIKYEKNPILTIPITASFHDPKILWHSDSEQWILVAAKNDRLLFYGSSDLKSWKYLSEFGHNKGSHAGQWICPDFFQTTIRETGDKKWVLLSSIQDGAPNGGSGVQYFIGEFDGKRFKLDQEFAPYLRNKGGQENAVWLDYGRDYHAAVIYSEMEEHDDRKIITAWLNNKDYAGQLPTDTWQGTMSFPRVIDIRSTVNGPRIFQSFISELISLRKEKIITFPEGTFTGEQTIESIPKQFELILEAGVTQDSTTVIGFELRNNNGEVYRLGFDAQTNNYFSDRTKVGENGFSNKFAKKLHLAPKQQDGALISMHILLDATSCELIADDGLTVLSEQFFPSSPFTEIVFFVNGLDADIQQLDGFELEGIW